MTDFPRSPSRMGWIDYQSTLGPLAMPLANTYYPLQNNALGQYTNKAYWLPGHGEIWNPTTNRFDFTSLRIGDTVNFRFSYTITTPAPNTFVVSRLRAAIGNPAEYSLVFYETAYKTATSFQLSQHLSMYIGNAETRDNPAAIEVSCDEANGSILVDGWFIQVFLR